MKKKLLLLLLSLFSILFFSCDNGTTSLVDDPQNPQDALSSEGNILTFTIDGNEGVASIDLETGTIILEVPPMDIRGIDPEIGLSAGAKLVEKPELKDGEAVKFVVEAEDGTQKDWMVTVNILPGVSFTLDGTKHVFTKGVINVTNEFGVPENVPWDTPFVENDDDKYALCALETTYDNSTSETDPESMFNFTIGKLDSAGDPIVTNKSYDYDDFSYIYYYITIDNERKFRISTRIPPGEIPSLAITFLTLPESRGDIFQAVFTSSVVTVDGDATTETIVEGFLKVIHSDSRFLLSGK